MTPTRILILSDGRPGHFNLSEGIALAIGRLRPAAVARVEVRRGRWPGPVLAAATNLGAAPRLVLERVYGLDPASLPAADVVVSAGAQTLAANVAAARHLGVPNIFYGSLRQFRAQDFALALTSYAHHVRHPRQAMALKPAAFDPDSMRAAGPLGDGRPLLGLVVGGTAGGFDYTADDWGRIAALVTGIAASSTAGFVVSNSRRTPAMASDLFAGLAAERPHVVRHFIDVRQPSPAPLSSLLAQAEAVLVTADSSSMVSEAVWARRPVLALMPAHARLEDNERAYRDWLAGQGWLATARLDTLDATAALAKLSGLTPIRDNPLDGLARLIAEKVPALRGCSM